MKKLLFLFIMMIVCFSCSSEDAEGEEKEKISYSIITKDNCNETEGTTYNEYCVSETTYNEIVSTWEDIRNDEPCHRYTFTDLEGIEVSGFFRQASESPYGCDGIVPDHIK